jgi:predicted alpha/beta-fold hydrolase
LVLIVLAAILMVFVPADSMAEITESKFRPHPLLSSPHLQTIWPGVFHRQSSQKFNRQRLELPDGDFLDLDWFVQNPDSQQVVVLIHGLGGSSASPYISRVGNELVRRGFRVVVFNLRGATEANRLPKTYHSGETMDLQYVLNVLSGITPRVELQVAGFSLGGNVLLKWLGENSSQYLVEKAVAVSVPFDLAAVADRLNLGSSRMYRHSILKNLKHSLRKKEALVKDLIDLQAAYRAKTFREFDAAVTAPLNNFESVEDYYSRSSSRQYLNAINTPTLILHSRDDPFATTEIIPQADELGPGVTLELGDRGGHVGFIGKGSGLSIHYWLPNRIAKFFSTD